MTVGRSGPVAEVCQGTEVVAFHCRVVGQSSLVIERLTPRPSLE
jgi:hypothetical protein